MIPASKGKLPRPSDKQLTPPTPKIVNLDPVLAVEPTVIVPQLNSFPDINIANYGDPWASPRAALQRAGNRWRHRHWHRRWRWPRQRWWRGTW